MKDKRTNKQKEFNRKLSQNINRRLFGIKPKKRVYNSSLDYYQCVVCPAKIDKEMADKIGKTTHCGKPFILNH